ncbi:hypothetical protein COU80_02590 [Candidatus Peregrinibacteria bacterium CG10_big_fil_rev_8_21_14_0_10_55_24]|nr:MAG: hypothetical protein COU80_02590 [Candidatus Peregrinibacteria bacterium CG10_big_fil_rev_8_21_14_0_10_55_24]
MSLDEPPFRTNLEPTSRGAARIALLLFREGRECPVRADDIADRLFLALCTVRDACDVLVSHGILVRDGAGLNESFRYRLRPSGVAADAQVLLECHLVDMMPEEFPSESLDLW